MTGGRTYLDYNATAPLLPEAHAAMLAAMDIVGNPSSVHAEGRAARALVEAAREDVAALVGCGPSEVVFTSGGTEANNQVMSAGWEQIALAGIEHDSVLGAAHASGAQLLDVRTRADGVVEVGDFAEHVLCPQSAGGRMLATLQLANNETGVLQPVADLAAFARGHDVVTHTDAVQAAGRLSIDFSLLGVDLLTLSAHKIGGPKGVGALVIRRGVDVAALLSGGGQERRRRSGTENIVGIAGFGAAAKAMKQRPGARVEALRDGMEQRLLELTPDAVIIGSGAARLPNTTCIALPGMSAELLVIKLDLAGVSVSAGAACSSGKVAASHVLQAMGLEDRIARGAVRISVGDGTTEKEIDRLTDVWRDIAHGRKSGQRDRSVSRASMDVSRQFAVGEI